MDGNPDESAELRFRLGQVDDQTVGQTNGRSNVTGEQRQHRNARELELGSLWKTPTQVSCASAQVAVI
jgi:hypothetical protein